MLEKTAHFLEARTRRERTARKSFARLEWDGNREQKSESAKGWILRVHV